MQLRPALKTQGTVHSLLYVAKSGNTGGVAHSDGVFVLIWKWLHIPTGLFHKQEIKLDEPFNFCFYDWFL